MTDHTCPYSYKAPAINCGQEVDLPCLAVHFPFSPQLPEFCNVSM